MDRKDGMFQCCYYNIVSRGHPTNFQELAVTFAGPFMVVVADLHYCEGVFAGSFAGPFVGVREFC